MTEETLHDLLVQAELINEDQQPNSSHEYVATCFECESKKLYVNASEDKFGLYKCQKCQVQGNYEMLFARIGPQTEEQEVYHAFHVLSQRLLVSNTHVTQHLTDERDFSEEDIKEFGFGYVDKTWYREMLKRYTKDQLEEHGLLNEKGNPVFWNHVIIPYRLRTGGYENFKGRCLDDDCKQKYAWLAGRPVGLFQSANLYRSGRTFLTEGEFKAAYASSLGYNAVGLSGVGNFKKHLNQLNAAEDLWIVFDSDKPNVQFPQGCGQESARKLASMLRRCHVVTLPYTDEKVGWDDYLQSHGVEDFDSLCDNSDLYIDGELQKSQSLALIVSEWRDKAKAVEENIGFNIGFERINGWMGGLQPGSLAYMIGAPHHGKSSFLRAMALNLYDNNPDLLLDYVSNDDSLKVTIGHFVAMIGELNASDTKQPTLAYATNRKLMKQWEVAVTKLQSMSSRMKMIDRSYRVSLEDIYEDLMRWRDKHPDGKRVLLIDGFNKIYSREVEGVEDGQKALKIKSDRLKLMAQEADVPVVCTIDPPKLYGRRPTVGDMAGSAIMEFDADLILSSYIDAQNKGLQNTDLKMIVDYADGSTDTTPVIEVNLHKNKQTGEIDLDLFILHKSTSMLEELNDVEHQRNRKLVYASQNKDRQASFKPRTAS